MGGAGGLHHHGDELHAVPLRSGGQAVEGGVRGAGLQPRGSGIKAHQTVGIGQAEGTIPDGVHPDGGIRPDVRVVQDQLPGHEGDVIGRAMVSGGRKAGAVDKGGVLHAQLLGPPVHPLHEGGLAAGQVLRHGHRRVVA